MTRLRLPAALPSLHPLLRLIEREGRERGLSEKRLNELELAAEEILVNIFRYAYPDGEGEVEVECTMEGKAFVVRVTDWGVPFDASSFPEPVVQGDLMDREAGGLGIFFAHKMVDELKYHRDGNQNVLSLVVKVS